MSPVTFSQLIGRNVQRIREGIPTSQSGVSRALTTLGVRWPPSRVSQLEAGEVAATLSTALILAAALSRLANSPITVADLLRTDSRDELVELCSADPRKVHVVAPGVSDHFRLAADSTDALERFSLQRPYVITVASRVARKNLEVLGRSAETLADLGIDLVAVGGSRAEMVRPPTVGSIRDLGPMGDRDLAELYRSALAFVLPSKYEGYGLPVIEAMASGTAVVCSATTGLAEAAGGAALLVDPDDGMAIAEALVSIASSEDLRTSLVEKGYERTAGLTWQKTAESVDLICKSLI